MSEARLRQAIKQKWLKMQVYGVESPSEPGIPDLHFIVPPKGNEKSKSGWIELKYVKDNGAIKFRPNQPNWIRNYASWGGNVFVLVATQNKDFFLFHGKDVKMIANEKELFFSAYAICETKSLEKIEDKIICALTK